MTITDESLLAEFRTRGCEWCGSARGVECHHLHTRATGRLDLRVNLASLCCYCHRRHHDGNEPYYAQLLVMVATREDTTPEAIQQTVWALRRADRNATIRQALAGRDDLVHLCGRDGDGVPDRAAGPGPGDRPPGPAPVEDWVGF